MVKLTSEVNGCLRDKSSVSVGIDNVCIVDVGSEVNIASLLYGEPVQRKWRRLVNNDNIDDS